MDSSIALNGPTSLPLREAILFSYQRLSEGKLNPHLGVITPTIAAKSRTM
jgi:hypothetical protein